MRLAARLALCWLCGLALLGPTGCGSDEPDRPQPVPTNPELERYSKPGTPDPDQADTIAAACAAMLQHEAEGCDRDPSSDATADAADECVQSWRSNDSRGCGAAYARFIQCRTDSLDCDSDSGWPEDCDLYADAAFICATDFVQRTSCTPLSLSDLCEDSAYGYACNIERKPVPECEGAPDTASPAYCCF